MAKVAMILGQDFEDSEFRVPYRGLREVGHHVDVLGAAEGEMVDGKRNEERIRIDRKASDVDPQSYHAVVVPGGYSPDHLRTDAGVVDFMKRFARTNRPIAAVCHGPQLLIEAELVSGRTMTSWPSVRKDLENAGAEWVDRDVVEDGQFITSRKPEDLEAFTKTLLSRLQ